MNGFSVTYERFAPPDDDDEDYWADPIDGFLVEDASLRDAVAELGGALVAPSSWPYDPRDTGVWFQTVDPSISLCTGEHEYRALHLPAGLTVSTRRRIARLLGIKL